MSRRRPYTVTSRCAEAGCREIQIYEYDTRAEEAAGRKRQREHPYRCTRHANPEKVLRPDNLRREVSLRAEKVRYSRYEADRAYRERLKAAGSSVYGDGPSEFLDGLFWVSEDGDTWKSGFTHGPGFNAHADDFPEGTRLVVTARIELPGVDG